MTITHTPLEALEILVRDLNETTWSSWQSTSKFSIALNVAEQVLKREKAREAAPDLLEALQGILGYFDSGNSVSVSQATIKASSDEVKAARAAIAKATGGAAC